MEFRGAKSLLGLMVMALAFSTMAPANAVTSGQVCVRTPSGIAISTTVQWTFNGNSSREIATDANGCVNFPHLPQDEILLQTDGMEIRSGLVKVRHSDLYETVTVDSSGYVLLNTSTNPPVVKLASITFRTNTNLIAKPQRIAVGHAHRTISGPDEYQSIDTSPWTSSNDDNWNIQRNCPDDENRSRLCETYWLDDNGIYHFYYFGELAKDLRQLTWYDPDTDQTVTIPENPSAPFVRFKWRDTQFGNREFSHTLTEASQSVTLLQYASIRGIPTKPVKFKKGKPVKVTITLLDSYGKPWKNQWVFGSYEDAMKKTRKCKLKDYAKTNKKGQVTLTFCPNKSGSVDFFLESQFFEVPVDLYSTLQVKKSK